MAYLFGLASQEEITELESRGWEFEQLDGEIFRELQTAAARGDAENKMVGVFVDTDLFQIMTGPDWEPGKNPNQENDVVRSQDSRGLDEPSR